MRRVALIAGDGSGMGEQHASGGQKKAMPSRYGFNFYAEQLGAFRGDAAAAEQSQNKLKCGPVRACLDRHWLTGRGSVPGRYQLTTSASPMLKPFSNSPTQIWDLMYDARIKALVTVTKRITPACSRKPGEGLSKSRYSQVRMGLLYGAVQRIQSRVTGMSKSLAPERRQRAPNPKNRTEIQ